MFRDLENNLKAILFLLALGGSALAESPRYNGVDAHAADYYQTEIEKNKSRMPQQAGESDAAYAIRISHLDPNYTTPPTAQDDVAKGQGTLDRAVKLEDASAIAAEGERAAAAQAGSLAVVGFNGINQVISGGGMGNQQAINAQIADATRAFDAMTKYGQIKHDMEQAKIRNGEGAARLRYEPDDGGDAVPDPVDQDLVRSIVDGMSDQNRQVLAERGVDAEQLVERLLSGEVDTSDPNAILRELKDPRQLSEEDAAEVRALAESQPDPVGEANLAVAAAESAGRDLPQGRELTTGANASGQNLKDPSRLGDGKTEGKDLAGGQSVSSVAIRIINKELIGRAKQWLGGAKKDGRSPASVRASSAKVAQVRALLKKHLSAKAYYDLQDRGITAPRFGSNIFHMAHRQYREYHKWREARRR